MLEIAGDNYHASSFLYFPLLFQRFTFSGAAQTFMTLSVENGKNLPFLKHQDGQLVEEITPGAAVTESRDSELPTNKSYILHTKAG